MGLEWQLMGSSKGCPGEEHWLGVVSGGMFYRKKGECWLVKQKSVKRALIASENPQGTALLLGVLSSWAALPASHRPPCWGWGSLSHRPASLPWFSGMPPWVSCACHCNETVYKNQWNKSAEREWFPRKLSLILWKGSSCKRKSLKITAIELGMGEMTLKYWGKLYKSKNTCTYKTLSSHLF